jgi:hypothetical protein
MKWAHDSGYVMLYLNQFHHQKQSVDLDKIWY